MNNVKFMELLSIENQHNKTHLHIRIMSDIDFYIFWEIDNTTAAQLQNLFDSNGHQKYRLSMYSSLNTMGIHFQSTVTKTHRDFSETLLFNCSHDYSIQLESIRACEQATDIYGLPFIHSTLAKPAPVKTAKSLNSNNSMKHSFSAKFSWIATALSLTIIIAATSSQHLASSSDGEHNPVISAKTSFPNNNFIQLASMDVHNQTKSTNINTDHLSSAPVYTSSQTKAVDNVDNTDLLPENESTLPSISLDKGLTYSIPEGFVAITFDDGPSAYTKEIVDILQDYNVGATFFFLGSSAAKRPEAVKYVHEHGYAIGNHSMTHANLTTVNSEKLEAEVIKSSEAIEHITNEKITLFRPPYGALNDKVRDFVYDKELKIVQWDNDPKDWETRNAKKIVDHISNTKTSGSIILFHETKAIIDALPEVIELLLEQNLTIVNLD